MLKLMTIPGGEIVEVEESVGMRLYEQGKARLIPEEPEQEAAPAEAEAPEADREPETAADREATEAEEAPEAKSSRKTRKK